VAFARRCLRLDGGLEPLPKIRLGGSSIVSGGLLTVLATAYVAARSRAVREPRRVLEEFGTHLSGGVEVRVHDSTADIRYLVLPMRPKGSTNMSEAELAGLVTRDCMIGTSLPTGIPGRS